MNVLLLILEVNAIVGLTVAIILSVFMKMKPPRKKKILEVKNGIPKK